LTSQLKFVRTPTTVSDSVATVLASDRLDALREVDDAIVTIPVIKKPRGTFWVIDCETDPFHNCQDLCCKKCGGKGRVPKPFLWGIYEGESDTYHEFETVRELIDFIRDIPGIFYAHNGGKFDYHYLRDHINTDESLLLINGRLAKFKIGRAEFRDSLNIFPNTRLKDFNDSSGGKIEIDYELMEPDRRTDPNARAEISKYLKQDCVMLWEKVRRYWDDYGKSITQASSSMKYWSKMYDIEPPRQTKTQHEKYSLYYYGGRVQCFESGVKETNFAVADINSAYPTAMLDYHPLSPQSTRQRHLPADETEFNTSLIDLSCTARGCFPWREPDGNKLFFPDDEHTVRRYWVTGWELRAALELDAAKNIRINNVHVFSKRVSFRQYITHFFNLREEARKNGDVAGRIFGKYFMNSLYGKFGADCQKYAEYILTHADHLLHWESQGYAVANDWGDKKLLAREPTEAQLNDTEQKRWRYFNVATAASITGFVRATLFKAMSACSGLIYCDTDSIAARDVSRLNFGTELGAFKHEGEFDSFAIAGKKLYAFHKAGAALTWDPHEEDEKKKNWKIACKGVNFASMIDGPERIACIARGEKIVFAPQVPTYTVTRQEPIFINRTVVNTYQDMSQAPNTVHKINKNIDPIRISF
jgi:hypothetical protein